MNPDVLQNRLYYTSKSKPLFNQVVPIHKNQYHIEEELGKGSFGKVYAARRLSDGNSVLSSFDRISNMKIFLYM